MRWWTLFRCDTKPFVIRIKIFCHHLSVCRGSPSERVDFSRTGCDQQSMQNLSLNSTALHKKGRCRVIRQRPLNNAANCFPLKSLSAISYSNRAPVPVGNKQGTRVRHKQPGHHSTLHAAVEDKQLAWDSRPYKPDHTRGTLDNMNSSVVLRRAEVRQT